MIARLWRGTVKAERADEYLAYLENTGLADYKNTPGNQGIQILRRTQDGKTEFTLITLWDSYDSIRAFAGDDYEQARYYDEDAEFLFEMAHHVEHYEWSSY